MKYYCRVCNQELLVEKNWKPSGAKYQDYICRKCKCQLQRDHRKTEAGKAAERRYNTSEKGRATKKRLAKLYALTENGKLANRRRVDKYHQTEKGHKTRIKAQNKRLRNYGFVELFPNPFPEDVVVEWHHVTDKLVVALPKEIHNMCRKGPGADAHREKCWPFVKVIYSSKEGIKC